MENIKFSVLVPVYNVEKYIDECVLSVINQTYSNWELILVDDGTPDNSGVICDKYADKDKRIKVIHKNNQGLMSARRTAIGEATGDYYCFLDSDDYLDNRMLMVLYEKILRYDCDLLVFGYEKFYDGRVYFSTKAINEFMTDKRLIYRTVFSDYAYNSMCRKCAKSSLFGDKDYSLFYKYAQAEDLLQSIELYKKANNLLFIEDCLYRYRLNQDSITHSITYDNFKMDFYIRDYVYEFLKNEECFTKSDMEDYCKSALRIFSQTILTIIRFDIEKNKKILLLSELSGHEYFKKLLVYNNNFLGVGKKAYVLLTLLKARAFDTLILIGKVK